MPFSASGRISSGTGSLFGAIAAYRFSDFVGAELELDYLTSHFDRFSGGVSVGNAISTSGTFPLSGDQRSWGGFLTAIITPFGAAGVPGFAPALPLVPYFGAGSGIASIDATLGSLGVGPLLVQLNQHSSETIVALNAVVGADIRIAPELALDVRYRYLWAASKHLGQMAPFTATSGGLSGSLLSLSLNFFS